MKPQGFLAFMVVLPLLTWGHASEPLHSPSKKDQGSGVLPAIDLEKKYSQLCDDKKRLRHLNAVFEELTKNTPTDQNYDQVLSDPETISKIFAIIPDDYIIGYKFFPLGSKKRLTLMTANGSQFDIYEQREELSNEYAIRLLARQNNKQEISSSYHELCTGTVHLRSAKPYSFFHEFMADQGKFGLETEEAKLESKARVEKDGDLDSNLRVATKDSPIGVAADLGLSSANKLETLTYNGGLALVQGPVASEIRMSPDHYQTRFNLREPFDLPLQMQGELNSNGEARGSLRYQSNNGHAAMISSQQLANQQQVTSIEYSLQKQIDETRFSLLANNTFYQTETRQEVSIQASQNIDHAILANASLGIRNRKSDTNHTEGVLRTSLEHRDPKGWSLLAAGELNFTNSPTTSEHTAKAVLSASRSLASDYGSSGEFRVSLEADSNDQVAVNAQMNYAFGGGRNPDPGAKARANRKVRMIRSDDGELLLESYEKDSRGIYSLVEHKSLDPLTLRRYENELKDLSTLNSEEGQSLAFRIKNFDRLARSRNKSQ